MRALTALPAGQTIHITARVVAALESTGGRTRVFTGATVAPEPRP
jgi:Na+-translocating ferredoxin:NAD+ oxidoreductase RnfG subunit